MAKKYSECKACNTTNFLNYAGLCKKCNREAAGSGITEVLAAKHQQQLEAQAEKDKQKLEDLKVEQAKAEAAEAEPETEGEEKKESEEEAK